MNFNQIGTVLNRNSTHILTGAAVLGVIGTTVLAVKGTPRAQRLIEDACVEKTERTIEEPSSFHYEHTRLTPLETVKATWQPYLPAVLVGAATIACIVGANAIGTRRQAALAAGAAVATQALREYREQVVETIGENKEEEIRAQINERKVAENPPSPEVLVEQGDKVLCYDTFSSRYFYSTVEDIKAAQNAVNLTVINDMYAPQNDFYTELGLARVAMGDEYGWNTDTSMNIYFTSILTPDNKPVVAIDYHNLPITNYNTFW